jgi:hypothetical protein
VPEDDHVRLKHVVGEYIYDGIKVLHMDGENIYPLKVSNKISPHSASI